MLKKIFNSDKKYYLELDEIQDSKPVKQVVKAAEKVAEVVQEKATEVLESNPVQQAEKTAEKTADKAQDKLQSVAAETKSKTKSGKKEVKKVAAKTEKEPQAETKPSLKDAGASSFDPPFWVAAMYNNNGTTTNKDGTQVEQTFATDNLMPTVTKYRRRPGPSLNKFKDMANEAKTPRR